MCKGKAAGAESCGFRLILSKNSLIIIIIITRHLKWFMDTEEWTTLPYLTKSKSKLLDRQNATSYIPHYIVQLNSCWQHSLPTSTLTGQKDKSFTFLATSLGKNLEFVKKEKLSSFYVHGSNWEISTFSTKTCMPCTAELMLQGYLIYDLQGEYLLQ